MALFLAAESLEVRFGITFMFFLAELMVFERPDPASEEERSPQLLLHPAAGCEGTGGSPWQLILVRAAGVPGVSWHEGPGNLA